MTASRLAEPQPSPWRGMLVVAAIVGGLVLWRAIVGREPEVAKTPAPTSLEDAKPPPPVPPRCTEIAADPFLIGDPPATPKTAPAEPGAEPEEVDDPTAPFAVEVGRGAVFDGGFAVGARRDEKGGAVAMLATLGTDGKGGKLVRLGRMRGDLDAPVIAGAGSAVIAVMIEPNAGGRALKVAKVVGDQVTWGPELSEGRDDSLAIDVAASEKRAVVVWDDLVGTAHRPAVMLSTIDVAAMRVVTMARAVSGEHESAERPRIIARPGGYWLAYAVRGKAAQHPSRDRKGSDHKHDDDDDDRELGEAIATTFVELLPLDEAGAPVGAPRAVTPKTGHVLSYDLDLGEDGGALIAWRDDDTPTGSGGGRVLATVAKLGGVGEARVLAEETSSAGAPELLPGWISIASISGGTRLAALSPRAELLDELAPERALGAGVPAAATRDAVLLARPMGQAMRLSVVRCVQRPRPEPQGDAGG